MGCCKKMHNEQMSSAGKRQTPGMRVKAKKRKKNGIKEKIYLLYNPLKSKEDNVIHIENIRDLESYPASVFKSTNF